MIVEFDPIGQLAQARKEQPLLDVAYNRVEGESQRYLEPVIEYFARLEKEIAEIPIAERFSRKKKPNFDYEGNEKRILPQYRDLSEADFKRAELQIALTRARNRAMSVIGEIKDLVLDIEATKQD